MFQLDDQFLAEIGLAALPEEQKKPFLQHIYEQLEYRVGIRLSDGMTDTQLQEFESIIDHKQEVIDAWIAQYAPAYTTEEVFIKIQQASGLAADDPALKAEYAATKWLEVNRPDYRAVVAQTLDELKQEIMQNKDALLGGAPQQQAPAQPPVQPQVQPQQEQPHVQSPQPEPPVQPAA